MLKLLRVKNLALIDELELEMKEGLNVLTGETGAGKSIIINAISLTVGGRFDIEQIRSGADEAFVEAVFDLRKHETARKAISQMCDMEVESLSICRVIERGGKTRCTINGRPATVKLLKQIGSMLVDIHGQHEHQSLLHPETHLSYLDKYGGERISSLLEEYRKLYDELMGVEALKKRIMSSEREREQRIDLLRYQMREIDTAALRPGEEEELLSERQRLIHAEKLAESIGRIKRWLSGDEEVVGVSSMLADVLLELKRASRWDENLNTYHEHIEQLLYSLEDISMSIERYASKIEFDPKRLEEVEGRLALISSLKRKYGDSIEEIIAYRDKIAQELAMLEASEEHIEELEKLSFELRQKLSQVAGELSRARKMAAKEMEKAVEHQLRSLMMDRARFKVSITNEADEDGLQVDGEKVAFDRDGVDRVEFLISPNPGEPLKPLAKIASGGEISRVMLALKALIRSTHDIPTLIFDEIDVGIGGSAAEAVGERLKSVSKFAQVICVTHLPSIACMADAHIYVEKVVSHGRTLIKVRHLSFDERVREIARMLAGRRVTETTLKQAQEMLLRYAA